MTSINSNKISPNKKDTTYKVVLIIGDNSCCSHAT